jgi:hypothetical protein
MHPPPPVFVSADFKGFSFAVSPLFATDLDTPVSADPKGLGLAPKLCKFIRRDRRRETKKRRARMTSRRKMSKTHFRLTAILQMG